MHCMYCGMPKSTCLDEATSNSEKVKPALAVIELRMSEGISQSSSQCLKLIINSNMLKTFRKA